MIRIRRRGNDGQRGQGLVELAIILPIILTILISAAELGLIYGKMNSLGYGSREGARTGSALAHGGVTDCAGTGVADSLFVDDAVVSAVQRILKSPDSGIDLARVEEIKIFRATDTGAVLVPYFNIWNHAAGGGPLVDEVDGLEVRLDFRPTHVAWNACDRSNGANPDSIGVTVKYKYEYVTPFPVVVNAISGGALEITLSETTVMALNPTIEN